jgi:hypothetical protein
VLAQPGRLELTEHRQHQAACPAEQADAFHSQLVGCARARRPAGEAVQLVGQVGGNRSLQVRPHRVEQLLQARCSLWRQLHLVKFLVGRVEQRPHPQ